MNIRMRSMGKDKVKQVNIWGEVEEIFEVEDEWKDMPEFITKDKTGFHTIKVHFETEEDIEKFAKLIGQRINLKTKYIWYPKVKEIKIYDKEYRSES